MTIKLRPTNADDSVGIRASIYWILFATLIVVFGVLLIGYIQLWAIFIVIVIICIFAQMLSFFTTVFRVIDVKDGE